MFFKTILWPGVKQTAHILAPQGLLLTVSCFLNCHICPKQQHFTVLQTQVTDHLAGLPWGQQFAGESGRGGRMMGKKTLWKNRVLGRPTPGCGVKDWQLNWSQPTIQDFSQGTLGGVDDSPARLGPRAQLSTGWMKDSAQDMQIPPHPQPPFPPRSTPSPHRVDNQQL